MFAQITFFIVLTMTVLNTSAANNQNNGVIEQLNILKAEIAALKAQQIPVALTLTVDCDNSESLMNALATPAKDLLINFSGTCIEDVTITRDRVSIHGIDAAIIQGQLVAIHTGTINLENFLVNESPGIGFNLKSTGTVMASNVAVENAAEAGFLIQGGRLNCVNCSAQNNLNGLVSVLGGALSLAGDSDFSGNSIYGVILLESSSLLAADASNSLAYTNLTMNNNGEYGLMVSNGSSVRFENNTEFSSSITANSNGLAPGLVHFS